MEINGYELSDVQVQQRHDCDYCEFSCTAEKEGKTYLAFVEGYHQAGIYLPDTFEIEEELTA